ncbi:MAG TPA: hypothetical protein VKA77_17340 [Mycobacterium sp.]|nr:hypothetical protein [Mycobacterium sp.]
MERRDRRHRGRANGFVGQGNLAWYALGSGYVAAYRVTVDDRLPETLAEVWSLPSPETWTALEITGTATDSGTAVVCTVRSHNRPGSAAPIPGLTLLRGRQRHAIDALNPLSVDRLEAGPVSLTEAVLGNLRWPVATPALTRT